MSKARKSRGKQNSCKLESLWRKTIIKGFLVSLLVLVVLNFVSGNRVTASGLFAGGVSATQAIMDSKEEVTIASYDDGEFYVLDEEEDPIGGYAYELQTALNRYLNWDITYQSGTWKTNLDDVKSGSKDIVFGAFKTDEREKDYVYNKTPIAMVTNYICGRVGDELLRDDYTKLAGKTFGLVEGTTSSKLVKDYLDEQGIEVSYVTGDSAKTMRKLLASGEIDAYVTNANIDNEQEKIIQEFSREPMYIMATKDKQELVDAFDQAIERMNSSDPSLMKSLLSKVYVSKSACISTLLEDSDWTFLSTAKPLRCGVIKHSQPYFTVTKDGIQEGIIKEISNQILEGLGLEIILIPYDSYEAELQGLRDGQIDMLGRTANDWNAANDNEVNLTTSYLSTVVTIAKSKNIKVSADIEGKAAIVEDYVGHSRVLQLNMPMFDFVYYNTTQECVDAVNRGEVESAIIEDFSALVNQDAIDNIDKLYTYTANGIYFEHCFAVSDKLDLHYVEILDKAISNLDTTDINRSAINAIDSGYSEKVVSLFLEQYRYQIILGVVIVIILVMLSYVFYSRYEQEQLRVGDERFKIAVKHAQVAYWEYDCEKEELIVFSEELSKRHGIPYEQPMHIDFNRNKPNFNLNSIAQIKEGLDKLKEGHKDFETDLQAKDNEGKNYYYKLKMTAIRKQRGRLVKSIGSILDVTEKKRILQLYEEESTRNKMVGNFIRASAMANITKDKIDTHSDFLLAKRNALSDHAYSDVIEQIIEQIKEETQKHSFQKMFNRNELLEAYKNGHRDATITVQMPHDGKFIWEEITIHTMEDPVTGDIKAALYARDAKERETLQSALDLAEQANNAKSNFLAAVSHEIRTPMNAIIGLTDMAIEETEEENETKIYKYLHNIKRASEYLLAIINDILEMSRIESGKTNLIMSEISMKAFLQTISTIIGAQAKEKGVGYSLTGSEDLRPSYIGDEIKLEKVLINILGNAVKFTGKGGSVHLDISAESVGAKRSMIRFIIKDTGIGMDQEYIKRIFEPFSREIRQASNFSGTGLGMSISKNFVELMDGDIVVESEIGVGTKITVTVALKNGTASGPVQRGVINTRKNQEKLYVRKEFNGRNVMLVEDQSLNVMIANNFLTKMGFHVEVADNGQMAIDLFEASEMNYYFAILMDIQMPVMGGLEATKFIRRLERKDAKTVPIIAMTANAFDVDRQKSLDAGMNEHVTKPIDANLVAEILMEIVKKELKDE